MSEESKLKEVASSLHETEAIKDPARRLVVLQAAVENVIKLQELRKLQTATLDELRFVLEYEREMIKLSLDYKAKGKWHLIPRGHVFTSSTPRRLVAHTKWEGALPHDVVGVCDNNSPGSSEIHYFELPIKRHARSQSYQSCGSTLSDPKGPIHGFGAKPKPEEEL